MKKKVLNTIEKYRLISPKDVIVVGVSGGPDSICLLHLLLQFRQNLDFTICVAHINHGIRKEAIEDEKYVIHFCEENNISYYIKREDIAYISRKEKIGTEETGRKVRYEFFNEVMQKVKATKIATAHTASDNAETILMNFIRGTGISGLKGIQPIRDDKYIRPLIECTREEIEEYCKQNKLNPRYDKTNQENIYTRNKIRNILLPLLEKEFNPNVISCLNRLSQIATREDEYFNKTIEKLYREIRIEEESGLITLDLKKFNQQEVVLKNRLILYTITKLFGSSQGIEMVHIQDIIQLCENNIGNKFLIPNKKVKILVKNRKIFFISNSEQP